MWSKSQKHDKINESTCNLRLSGYCKIDSNCKDVKNFLQLKSIDTNLSNSIDVEEVTNGINKN